MKSIDPPGLLDLPAELLAALCDSLPRRTCLELAVACKTLHETALRAIYRNLSDDGGALEELDERDAALTWGGTDRAAHVASLSFGSTVEGYNYANSRLLLLLPELIPRLTRLRKLHLRYAKLADSLVSTLELPETLNTLHLEGIDISPSATASLLHTIPETCANLEELLLVGLPQLPAEPTLNCVSRLPRLLKLHLGAANAWSQFPPETCHKLAFEVLDHGRRGPRLRSLGLYQFSNRKGVLLPFLRAHGETLEELVIEFRSSMLGNSIPPANDGDYVMASPENGGSAPPVTASLDTHVAALFFSHPPAFPPNLKRLSLAGLLTTDPRKLLSTQRNFQSGMPEITPCFPSIKHLSLTPMFRIRSFSTEPPYLLSLLDCSVSAMFPNLEGLEMSAMGRTRRSRLPDGDIARILDGLDAWGLKSLYVGERGLDFGNESLRVVEKWRGLKELALPVCVVSDGPILAKARELLDRLPGIKKVEVLGAPDNILRQAEECVTYHFSCRLVWPPNWTSNSVTVMI